VGISPAIGQAITSRNRSTGVPHLTDLELNRGFTGDLEHLAGHTQLRLIQAKAEKKRLDLDVFASLPNLTGLHLFHLAADQDLTAVSRLGQLTALGVAGASVTGGIFTNLPALIGLHISPPSPWDLDILAPLSRLQWFTLTDAAEPTSGFDQLAGRLSELNHLTSLYLYECRWLSDLEPLTQVTSLRHIGIDDTSVIDLAPLASLPRLQWLYIGNTNHVLDLTPLSNLQELTDLSIVGPAPGIDLTPLQGKRMTVHLAPGVELANPARPEGIRIKRF
jgi:hypothetical protein